MFVFSLYYLSRERDLRGGGDEIPRLRVHDRSRELHELRPFFHLSLEAELPADVHKLQTESTNTSKTRNSFFARRTKYYSVAISNDISVLRILQTTE